MDDDEDFDDDQSFSSIDEMDGASIWLKFIFGTTLIAWFFFIDDGKDHLLELSKLAEKDPEFYKYLQENDKELLEFNPDALDNAASSDEEGEDVEMEEEEEKTPNLTKNHLKQWQKGLLQVCTRNFVRAPFWLFRTFQHRSLRSLRKLLIAFRSAVHMNEDGQVLAWTIDSASGAFTNYFNWLIAHSCVVYSKLIETTLRYTPVVLAHHVPYKTLPNGKL